MVDTITMWVALIGWSCVIVGAILDAFELLPWQWKQRRNREKYAKLNGVFYVSANEIEDEFDSIVELSYKSDPLNLQTIYELEDELDDREDEELDY